ncbi:MAG: type II methionyl aminopeptidase [Methanomicrobiales archaeon]|jgi:methionyl aminopeptidase|nr:type II methionyl aminopeptidase [Methanomicrobiales archaeon]
MNDEILTAYCEAGKVASRILDEGRSMVKVGAPYLEVVEAIEARVTEEGLMLAFPLNLSLNEDAAHDTASGGDARTFKSGDLAKLDLGVALDGYIADTACSIDLGSHDLLVEASSRALSAAIEKVRPGVPVGEIGGAIYKEITDLGFRPIANLTGHGLDRFVIHKPPNIPNIPLPHSTPIEEGMVFAIEPFATTGSGFVTERRRTEIFQQVAEKPVRVGSARLLMEEIRTRNGLPFAKRWFQVKKTDIGLTTLQRTGAIRSYPVLSDTPGSFVSQAEHTVIVTDTGCIVTTR